VYLNRGFGQLYKTDPSTGNVIDCDSWSNLFESVCWNPFAASVVPVAPGGGTGTPITDSSGNVVIAGASAVPAPAAVAAPSSGLSTMTWIAIAAIGAFAIVAIGGGSPARYGR
jgi:hypothetical protein